MGAAGAFARDFLRARATMFIVFSLLRTMFSTTGFQIRISHILRMVRSRNGSGARTSRVVESLSTIRSNAEADLSR
jgi:hypothetical protein